MRSCDTNILLYAYNADCPEWAAANSYLESVSKDADFAICELVLVEFYVLLRNPRVLSRPLSAEAAVERCQTYRTNPIWKLIDYNSAVIEEVWKSAARPEAGYRQIFDARLAQTLLHHGVREFATRNESHFHSFGFEKLWNPIDRP